MCIKYYFCKLIKSDNYDISNFTKDLCQIDLIVLSFDSSKNPEINISRFS